MAAYVNLPPSESTPNIAFGSSMRSHGGNKPVLPQDKECPHCDAKFTRTTHLNRHIRNHTKEGLYTCGLCGFEFTRKDLLSRHLKTCKTKPGNLGKTSCVACSEAKLKCDLDVPACSSCTAKGKECLYPKAKRRKSRMKSSNTQKVISVGFATDLPSMDTGHVSVEGPRPVAPDAAADLSVAATVPLTQLNNPELSLAFPAPSSYTSEPSTSTFSEATDVLEPSPVASHLTSYYNNDMFQPLFTDVFADPNVASGSSSSGTATSNSPPTVPNGTVAEDFPFITNAYPDQRYAAVDTYAVSSNSTVQPSTLCAPFDENGYEFQSLEVDHFLNLFYTAFLDQMPIAHPKILRECPLKPPILMSAMAACGALFVQTKLASSFITAQLAAAREKIPKEFARNPTDHIDQLHLIMAVVLLQTIGLFHQNASERASSSMYHGMVVMMIRRTGLIGFTASCDPAKFSMPDIEASWQNWVTFEVTKRCIWLSYLHDCYNTIYFATGSSYQDHEMELTLPCEDTLFKCGSAYEWYSQLQMPSAYGNTDYRLWGTCIYRTLNYMTERRLLTNPQPIPPLAHCIVIHSILRNLFFIGVTARLYRPSNASVSLASDQNQASETWEDMMHDVQYALHNWLQSWLACPDVQSWSKTGEEPNFLNNALPLYWLGQVAILAYQDNHPPFIGSCPTNRDAEARFRLMKRWLRHIRRWLSQNNDDNPYAPTLFWDELMKIRLQIDQTWQCEPENEAFEQGLVGFFTTC